MKTTLKLILLYFAYQLMGGAVMAGLSLLTPIDTTTQLGWALLLSGAAMMAHLVGFGYVSLPQSLRPVRPGAMLASLVCIVGTALAGNALSVLIPLPNWLESDFSALSHTALGAFSIALLAPCVEELLFRGAILQRLHTEGTSPWRSIVLSALVFGLVHVNPAQVPFAFLVGVAFGWITVCTRSLVPVIVGHALNNSLGVVEMYLYGDAAAPSGLETESAPVLLAMAAVGIAVAIITGRMLTPTDSAKERELNN